MLQLSDFAWTTGAMHTEASVKREIPECQGFTEGVDVEFKSDEGPLSIIPVTLRAKASGRLALVPELFLVRDGGLYGVYRLCLGVRLVDPRPDPSAAAFHPPADGRQWPGHAGWIGVTAGQSVVIELLFGPLYGKEAEVLAAAPVARVFPG